jgi:hypothetical protein
VFIQFYQNLLINFKIMNTKYIIATLLIAVAILAGYMFYVSNKTAMPLANFNECVAAGNPVMESYPRQCRDKSGKLFTENIGNTIEKRDLIVLESVQPNEKITSPLTLKGRARGYWYFEASFPVEILDGNGNKIGQGLATAQDEWMTEDFVPFEAPVTFTAPTTANGTLVLHKDNPSGLPEHDDKLLIPVTF